MYQVAKDQKATKEQAPNQVSRFMRIEKQQSETPAIDSVRERGQVACNA
ncbi:MAG: hypothetical protein IPP55_09525 [Anaerolineales bacterium]|nr:hypothetical protein [Anaerolineales bacterium]